MSGDKEDFVQVSSESIKVFDENGEIRFVFEGLKIRSVVDVDHQFLYTINDSVTGEVYLKNYEKNYGKREKLMDF